MYVKECDVAWGSHAKVYSEKEYTHLNTHVMTSWYDAYTYEIKIALHDNSPEKTDCGLQLREEYFYNSTCTISKFSCDNGFNR